MDTRTVNKIELILCLSFQRDESMLTFEGVQLQGVKAIIEKIKVLWNMHVKNIVLKEERVSGEGHV